MENPLKGTTLNGMPVAFAICMTPTGELAFMHPGTAAQACPQICAMFESFKMIAYAQAAELAGRKVQPVNGAILGKLS